jgi:hypothetical protein
VADPRELRFEEAADTAHCTQMSTHPHLRTRPPLRGAVSIARRLKHAAKRALGHGWRLGLYRGPSPLDLRPCDGNPIITRHDITDVHAGFVADPFLAPGGPGWYLFFEVYDLHASRGRIALAESADLQRWRYRGVVLDEPFHLSYPHVFHDSGHWWMIPETEAAASVRLYRAVEFPRRWVLVGELLSGLPFRDASVVHHAGRWWMFVETSADAAYDTLRLFSAPALTGPWAEHPDSPVVRGDATQARPAGRMVRHDGQLLRLAQDCAGAYGTRVGAFAVTDLTEQTYAEEYVSQVVGPTGEGWNAAGMHHVDAWRLPDGTWIAAVDGRRGRM